MALLEDFQEPPSHGNSKQTEKIKILISKITKNKYHLNNILKKALVLPKPIFNHEHLKRSSNNFLGLLLRFYKEIAHSKYLKHAAVFLLVMLVVISNHRDKMLALASSQELVTVNPDTQYNVAATMDKFTLTIPDDGGSVEKSTVAILSRDGFISNSSTVVTQESVIEEVAVVESNDSKTINYVVQNGDTLTGIGWKFEVKLATLKYVNDITNIDSIKPGVTLKIPPKNYEVSATLIAKKEAQRQAKVVATTKSKTKTAIKYKTGTKNNGYPYGYCTYYVATMRSVPSSWGDAKKWLSSAQRSGYATGSTPAVGAIVVTSESWWGHVAFVESVNGNTITISEMNAKGWGVTSRRTLTATGGVVRGYIY